MHGWYRNTAYSTNKEVVVHVNYRCHSLHFPLKRLKYLNLKDNEIYSIPRLRLLGTNLIHEPHPSQGSSEEIQPTEDSSKECSLLKGSRKDFQPSDGCSEEPQSPKGSSKEPQSLQEEGSSSEQQSMRTKPNWILQPHKENSESLRRSEKDGLGSVLRRSPVLQEVDPINQNITPHLLAPFPELKTLSLVNNLVGLYLQHQVAK